MENPFKNMALDSLFMQQAKNLSTMSLSNAYVKARRDMKQKTRSNVLAVSTNIMLHAYQLSLILIGSPFVLSVFFERKVFFAK